MSTRLKSNIEKFLMEELMMNGQDSGLEEMGNSSSDGEFGFEKPSMKSNGTLKEFGLERSESSSDDDDKCQCRSMSQGSLSAIEEENSIKTKKGFRIWKSMKERNGTYSKSSISVKQKRLWRKDKGGTERSNSLPAVLTNENIEELTIPEANDNLISLTKEEVSIFFKTLFSIRSYVIDNLQSIRVEISKQTVCEFFLYPKLSILCSLPGN